MAASGSTPLMALTGLLAGGIGSQWLAWRLRLPSILVLLAVGLTVGSLGLFDPDALFGELLFPGVSLAVAVILFEGGLTLQLKELPKAGGAIARVVLLGVPITFVLATWAAWALTPLSLEIAAITGALLTVTGPTVVGPLLRHVRPRGQVAAIAKWEGILADVLGATLAVLVYEGVRIQVLDVATGSVLVGLGKTLAVGGALGALGALILAVPMAKRWVPDGLESPLTLAVVLTVYSVCQELQHESGLLAVTLMGVVLANQKRISVQHIIEFKENLRVLLISVLFIVLAARLEFGTLFGQPLGNWLFVVALILVVRPASIFVSLIGSDTTMQERLFLSWLAPRGIVAAAVSAVFALGLAEDGFEGAETLASLIFLVIAATVSLYGLTARPLARALKLATSDPQGVLIVGASRFGRALAETLKRLELPVVLVDTNRRRIAKARLAGLRARAGNILSEHVEESIDLAGIGRLFALLPNDEVNSLACLHHVHEFGRAEVYQLPTPKQPGEAPTELRGRALFTSAATSELLESRILAGAEIRRTRLSEEFDFAAWRVEHGESAIVLARLREGGKLDINTVDQPLSPKAGDIVIALSDPDYAPPPKEAPEGAGAQDEASTEESAEIAQAPKAADAVRAESKEG